MQRYNPRYDRVKPEAVLGQEGTIGRPGVIGLTAAIRRAERVAHSAPEGSPLYVKAQGKCAYLRRKLAEMRPK